MEQLAYRAFEEQAAATPTATALIFENRSVTYEELDQRANALAHQLEVRLDEPVGLSVERSIEMIIGFLGILKAGGAMLPLDPAYPADRLRYMVEDSRLRLIVTTADIAPI